MKRMSVRLIGAAVMTAFVTYGQGMFQDLDFESARVVLITNTLGGPPFIAVTNALPGWSAFSTSPAIGTNQLFQVAYNPGPNYVSTEYSIALLGSNNYVLSGNFSVAVTYGSIEQTGLVPTNAESLFFEMIAAPGFLVSLGGQNLSYVAISNLVNSAGQNYTLYGANISAFAGQIETLAFSSSSTAFGAELDNIQFSSIPIPEPGVFSLVCLGGGVLLYVIRRRHR